jgi:hypothetical protein
MRFEWDEGKNRSNWLKHKVSFEVAKSVFEDPHLLSLMDRFVDGEERWKSLGRRQASLSYWSPIPTGRRRARR